MSRQTWIVCWFVLGVLEVSGVRVCSGTQGQAQTAGVAAAPPPPTPQPMLAQTSPASPSPAQARQLKSDSKAGCRGLKRTGGSHGLLPLTTDTKSQVALAFPKWVDSSKSICSTSSLSYINSRSRGAHGGGTQGLCVSTGN